MDNYIWQLAIWTNSFGKCILRILDITFVLVSDVDWWQLKKGNFSKSFDDHDHDAEDNFNDDDDDDDDDNDDDNDDEEENGCVT